MTAAVVVVLVADDDGRVTVLVGDGTWGGGPPLGGGGGLGTSGVQAIGTVVLLLKLLLLGDGACHGSWPPLGLGWGQLPVVGQLGSAMVRGVTWPFSCVTDTTTEGMGNAGTGVKTSPPWRPPPT